jgi:hypothetical protein
VELSGAKKTDAPGDQKGSYGDQGGTQSAPLFVKIVPSEGADKPADKGHGPENNEASEEGGLVLPTWVLAVATVLLFAFTAALWKSTSNLVKSERAHAERELRAYLSVEPGGINFSGTPGQCMGHIIVRNVGKLPAGNVFVEAHLMMGPRETPIPDVPIDPRTIPRVIQPGALMRQGTVEIDSPWPDVVLGHAFVWGVAYYDDGYNIRRFTRLCHRYHPRSQTPRPLLRIGEVSSREIISPEQGRYHTEGNDAD